MIYRFLIKLGYRVNCKTGKCSCVTNGFDFLLLISYIVISGCNLVESEPSYLAWWLNIVIIARIVSKNVIEIQRIKKPYKENQRNDPSCIKEIIVVRFLPNRTIFEVAITGFMLLLMLICIIYAPQLNLNPKEGLCRILFMIIGIIVLIFSFLEDSLRIIEQLYDAELEPLIIQIENT